MTPQKFVVRLLDDLDQLVAWAEVYAVPKPQARGASCPFWPTEPTTFVIERAVTPSKLTIHWCELDVARVTSVSIDASSTAMQVGQHWSFVWVEPVWLVPGMRDVPLPAVTVRSSVGVTVPVGSLMEQG